MTPLELLAGDLDHRPELGILHALLAEALEQVSEQVLRRWLRTGTPAPVDVLTARDFVAFERALDDLVARGFVIRGGG